MGTAIFEIGALGFWILSGVVSIFIIFLLSFWDKPKYGWSTTFIIGTFILLYYFGGKGSLNEMGLWIKHHPFQFIGLFILYIIIGVLWSFVEWVWYVKKQAIKAKESNGGLSIDYFRPQIKKEKDRIFSWIFYWPWVMLWKLIHKPFTRIFNFIYAYTEATYEKITQNAFKNIKEDSK